MVEGTGIFRFQKISKNPTLANPPMVKGQKIAFCGSKTVQTEQNRVSPHWYEPSQKNTNCQNLGKNAKRRNFQSVVFPKYKSLFGKPFLFTSNPRSHPKNSKKSLFGAKTSLLGPKNHFWAQKSHFGVEKKRLQPVSAVRVSP